MRAAIRCVPAVFCLVLPPTFQNPSPPHQALTFSVVVAGFRHSCALTAEGVAYCWGANEWWQLGDGTQVPSAAPVRVAADARFKAIVLGDSYTCALTVDGQTWCWGGRAGGPATGNVRAFARLAAGGEHTCGVATDGAAYCWGRNDFGELGDGSRRAVSSQRAVAVSGHLSFTTLSAGPHHTCGITRDHKSYCWGSNASGQLGTGLGKPDQREHEEKPQQVAGGAAFSAITAGVHHTCGLNTQGAAFCWGLNASGQLGDGSTRYSGKPVAVAGGHIFQALSAGSDFTCGLAADSTAFCWGDNFDGELGLDTAETITSPMRVGGSLRFTTVSAGDAHICGVATSGELYCWGYRGLGRLGDGVFAERHSPVPVATAVKFTTLALGGEHTCGIATDSTAYCWGRGDVGQVGDGRGKSAPAPSRVSATLKFVSLSAGLGHTCGVAADGGGYCWGSDSLGQLGVSYRDARDCDARPCAYRPMEVRGDKVYTSLSAGDNHTCATTRLGEISCWGDNSGAQLGEPAESLGQSDKPKTTYKIGLLHFLPHLTFVTVTSGLDHSCAVTRDGETYCWGFGRTEPRQLAEQNPHQFSVVSAGGEETCGLVPAGRVFCWGRKGVHWQVTPRAVLFATISVGHWHSCGVTSDGTAFCWGEANVDGRLGTDDTLPHKVPVPVAGGLRFKAVTAGWWHTCGITTEGTAYCWGAGYRGQLGDRMIMDSPTPVRVAAPQ